MDLKTWLRKQPKDASPMGLLMSHAAVCQDAEECLVSISKGTHPMFGREFHGLAQGLVGQFKREGGKFKNAARFARVQAGPDIKGDVIAFRPRTAPQPANSAAANWTLFYATLLGLDITEEPVEIAKHREDWSAEVTVLMPTRTKRPRRSA